MVERGVTGRVSREAANQLMNKEEAEKMTGVAMPHEFPMISLDATELDHEEAHQAISEDIKMNHVRFDFPAGWAKVSVLDECRALINVDDFDEMYDFTMSLLVNKDVRIVMVGTDGEEEILTEFHVTHKDQDLRSTAEVIDKYPVLVMWMTEFIGRHISKKYPLPSRRTPQEKVAKKKKGLKQHYSTDQK